MYPMTFTMTKRKLLVHFQWPFTKRWLGPISDAWWIFVSQSRFFWHREILLSLCFDLRFPLTRRSFNIEVVLKEVYIVCILSVVKFLCWFWVLPNYCISYDLMSMLFQLEKYIFQVVLLWLSINILCTHKYDSIFSFFRYWWMPIS